MQCVVTGSICICLISVLLYKYLILDTSRPGALYLRERCCEVSWGFSKSKGFREQESFGNTALNYGMRTAVK
jgi:hypothetical protein